MLKRRRPIVDGSSIESYNAYKASINGRGLKSKDKLNHWLSTSRVETKYSRACKCESSRVNRELDVSSILGCRKR